MSEDLTGVLERSRTAGFLGPGSVLDHIAHAQRFAQALPLGPDDGPMRLLDIGSGGGLPGLVIFTEHPQLHGVLMDAMLKRTAFLNWAVPALGMEDRVEVARGRCEELAYDPAYRHGFDVVVARSFGPPAATVEAALGFMRVDSLLIISEPPEGRTWPDLTEFGLVPLAVDNADDPAKFGTPKNGQRASEGAKHSPSLAPGGTPDPATHPAKWHAKHPAKFGMVIEGLAVFKCIAQPPAHLPRAIRKQQRDPLF